MITIGTPKIIKKDKKARITCQIEINNETQDLWLEVDEKYGKYFITDRCDGFLIAMLPIAMMEQKDIICSAPVSEELLHNITTQLIPSVVKNSKNLYKTRISAEPAGTPVKNAGAVGTGISRGVDSMHSLSRYLNPKCPGYKLTHLLLHNAGAFSITAYNEKGQKERVEKECFECSEKLAQEIGLPLIKAKTNLSKIFDIKYHLYSEYYNLFPVLLLQKLWKIYFYGSTYDFSNFSLKNNDLFDCAHYELLLVNSLSTSNLRIYSEGGEKNRLEKTADITDFEPAQKNLHVCITDSKNCNKCIKCMRTLLCLDALDKLDNFKNVFDVEYYRRNRQRYVTYLENCHQKGDEINEPTYQAFKKLGWLYNSRPLCYIENIKLPPVSTSALIIKNLSTEKILMEKQTKTIFNSAGFSKIITALVALESGKTQMPVEISEKAYNGLKSATIYDLVNIMLITQNNIAALNIAQAVAGTVEDFVKLMNEKSAQIGAVNTLYSSPTGVNGENYTTAEDACKLMEYAIQNRHFCDIFKRKSYTIRYNEEEIIFKTTNQLLTEDSSYYIPECTASKYGVQGHFSTLSAVIEKDNDIYLAILLGVKEGEKASNCFKDTRNLMNCITEKPITAGV